MIDANHAIHRRNAAATPATRATIQVQGARGYVEQCMEGSHVLLSSFAQDPSVFASDNGEREYAAIDRFDLLSQVRQGREYRIQRRHGDLHLSMEVSLQLFAVCR